MLSFVLVFVQITHSLSIWERRHCNNVPVIITSNYAAKVFLQHQMAHYLVCHHFSTILMSPLLCEVESVLLLDAAEAFHLADGMYLVISRHSSFHLKNESRTFGLSVQTLSCHVCIIHPPSCPRRSRLYHGERFVRNYTSTLYCIYSIYSLIGPSLPSCPSSIKSFPRLFSCRS